MTTFLTRIYELQQILQAYGYSSYRVNSFTQEAFSGDLKEATEEELAHVISTLEGYAVFAEKCRNFNRQS